MSKTTPSAGPDEPDMIAVSKQFGPLYFIEDVPGVAGVSRRQVDREIQDGTLTRRKKGQLTFIQIHEVHELRAAVLDRKERTDAQR